MREGKSQIDRDVTVDIEAGLDGTTSPDRESEADQEEAGRIRSRLGSIATARSLAAALVFSVVGAVLFSFVPVLSMAGTVLGIAGGGFVYGLGSETRRYIEMAIAGAVTGGGATLLGNLVVAFIASGTTLIAVAVLGGALAGVIGHYFGRDLRAGLTADLD